MLEEQPQKKLQVGARARGFLHLQALRMLQVGVRVTGCLCTRRGCSSNIRGGCCYCSGRGSCGSRSGPEVVVAAGKHVASCYRNSCKGRFNSNLKGSSGSCRGRGSSCGREWIARLGVPRGTILRVGSGSQAVVAAAHDAAATTATESAAIRDLGHRLLQQLQRLLQQSLTPKAVQVNTSRK